MTTYEIVFTIVNIFVVIAAPIVAVKVGQTLQDKAQKRKDKMEIFKCLMTHRIIGWTNLENVNALNSIDIVFADCEAVRKQWKVLLSKLHTDVSSQEQSREQCKLMELMAVDLGYKDVITWDDIQNPYYPQGLDRQIEMNTQILNGQVEWAKAAGKFSAFINNQTVPATENVEKKQ